MSGASAPARKRAPKSTYLPAFLLALAALGAAPGARAQAEPALRLSYATAPNAPARRFVHSLDDFRFHTMLHRMRLVRIGFALHRRFPAAFPGIDPSQILDIFLAHDLEKVADSPEFFEAYEVPEDLRIQFARQLYAFYNTPRERLSAEEQARKKRVIDEMNALGRRIMSDLMDRLELGEQARASFLRMERLADVIDRNTDPVAMEEFALTEQLPLEMFLQGEENLAMARAIQADYFEITRGLGYEEARRSGGVCRVALGRFGSTMPISRGLIPSLAPSAR